jgi:hypothetical protein
MTKIGYLHLFWALLTPVTRQPGHILWIDVKLIPASPESVKPKINVDNRFFSE